MNTIAHRIAAGLAAAVTSTIILSAVASLFLPPAEAGKNEKARQHLPGGAGAAERYRAMQTTANDILLAPRAGVTHFRDLPGPGRLAVGSVME